jgi:hypothetical protein
MRATRNLMEARVMFTLRPLYPWERDPDTESSMDRIADMALLRIEHRVTQPVPNHLTG